MSSHEQQRCELHQLLETKFGPTSAAILMSYLPPVPWMEFATKDDLAIIREQMATKVELAKLETKMSDMESRLTVLITDMGNKFRDEMNAWSRTITISIVGSVLTAVALSFAAVHIR